VLSIVLRDSLHQPQYVEKLEKILRFLIKEKALSLDDLDAVWRAQAGKHEAIVKNVHDLLAKLAWDFDAEQLDHLFECFQASMKTANKKQRERLLELNRRLAEDDKNGVMAHKVLKLFWSLAHSADVPPEVLDQALASHVKILDYSCSQERDAQKTAWLDKCVEELKSNDNWVLPALRLIREICCLYEATPNHGPRTHPTLNRQQVIERLQNEHTLVILVTISLTAYLYEVRKLVEQQPNIKPTEIMLDKRYPHPQQIQERLDFLKFLLKDGQLWLCADQAKQIWQCLAVNAAFTSDREECFRWFGKLMGDEPDLDPHINKDFFENNILQLDPKLLTESGIKCFERFFKAVNSNAEKLKAKNRGYVLDDDNLIGKDYLWRVITTSGDDISYKAIELLKEVSTALGPRLQANIAEFHANFIDECCEKLRTHYEMILSLNVVIDESEAESKECKDIKISRQIEAEKMCRIIRVLQEYIKECDRGYTGERLALPLARASRGKHITIYLRFQNHSNRPIEDIEVVTHSNETIVSFKRNLQKRLKGAAINNIRIDLYSSNGELIEIADERHPLSQYNIRDKTFTVKLTPIGPGVGGGSGGGTAGGVGLASSTAAASSPDSSSDSSTGSPPRPCPELQRSGCEQTLPGVIISKKPVYKEFFVKLYQLGSDLQHGHLRECSRALLHLLPLDRQTVRQLQTMCRLPTVDAKVTLPMNASVAVPTQPQSLESPVAATCTADYLFLSSEPASVLYNLEVLHAILLPALDPLSDSTLQLQSAWLHSGGAHFILDLLTKNNFLTNADMHTKRAAYQCVLRLVKLFLYIVGCVLSRVGDEPTPSIGATDIAASGSLKSQVDILKQALTSFPGNSEHTLRASAVKLAQNLAEEMLSAGLEGDRCRKLFESVLQWQLPDFATIKAIVQLAWVSSIGNIQLLGRPNVDLSVETSLPEAQDFAVCKEALEVLSIALVLNHTANDTLGRDPQWNKFISSIVLANPSRHIRQNASEQLFLTCTYCASDRRPFTLMIVQLVETLQCTVAKYAASCSEFFQLLCRILNYGCMSNWPLPANDGLLSKEIQWLRKIRETVKFTGETQVHDDLLEGHLCLAKELMFYLNPELKSQLNLLITVSTMS
jgi:ubiquitin carboxyl-terminal hydrolase 9/24